MTDNVEIIQVNANAADVHSPTDFGAEHMRIVRDHFAAGASKAQFDVLWLGAKARGLDPIKRQIHFVRRWDEAKQAEVWASQVSIDGFRSLANATGLYDGQDEPEHEYNAKGELVLARVRVYRKDISRPFVGVARWGEYVQTKKGGVPTHFWDKFAHTMLDKCAEALALRKAFPEALGGLYTSDEMAQADVAPPRVESVAKAPVDVTNEESEEPNDEAHAKIIADARVWFTKYGISDARIERYFGALPEEWTTDHVGALAALWAKLKAKETTIAKEFPREAGEDG